MNLDRTNTHLVSLLFESPLEMWKKRFGEIEDNEELELLAKEFQRLRANFLIPDNSI